jgi:hypothetical protein
MLSPLSMKFLSENSELCNDKQHTPVLLLCIKHLIQPTSSQVLRGHKYKLDTLHIEVGDHDWMVAYMQLNTFLQFNVSFNSTVPTAEVYSDF